MKSSFGQGGQGRGSLAEAAKQWHDRRILMLKLMLGLIDQPRFPPVRDQEDYRHPEDVEQGSNGVHSIAEPRVLHEGERRPAVTSPAAIATASPSLAAGM